MKRHNKLYVHPYPRIKGKYSKEVEKAYQDALETYNSWSIEERERRGFGKGGGHPHSRRLFIFLNRYFTELKYFTSTEDRDKYILPWVCATRSERLKAIKVDKVYFQIKQTVLKNSILKYKNFKLEQELK